MTTEAPSMNITLSIPQQRIADLLFGHQGSVSSWLHSISGDSLNGVHVHYDTEEDQEGVGSGRKWIDYAAIQKGLAAMALANPNSFGAFLREDDDDIDFDVAWQCIIFGKTIYA